MNDSKLTPKHSGEVFVYISAAIYGILGLLFIINPAGMASGLGFVDLSAEAINEISASYGGLWLAIGLYLCFLVRGREVKAALALISFTFAGFAFGRLTGALRLGAFHGLHCYWLAFELLYMLISNFYLRKYKSIKEKNA